MPVQCSARPWQCTSPVVGALPKLTAIATKSGLKSIWGELKEKSPAFSKTNNGNLQKRSVYVIDGTNERKRKRKRKV
jgi:hypothetical protein